MSRVIHGNPTHGARLWAPMIARSPTEPHRAATPLELLFDLAFVVAIAQAAEGLHHSIAGAHTLRGLVDVQSNYRTLATPEGRALSGLSMGGIQTLNVGLHSLGTFRYVAVMSSGWTTDADREFFYKSEAAKIPTYNKQLKLFWWGWGETDIARVKGLAVIDKLKSQGVTIETMETPGGHEWTNWRMYLREIGPKLFR